MLFDTELHKVDLVVFRLYEEYAIMANMRRLVHQNSMELAIRAHFKGSNLMRRLRDYHLSGCGRRNLNLSDEYLALTCNNETLVNHAEVVN